jgi:hypothetical protein
MNEHRLNKRNPFIRGYYIDPAICDAVIAESKDKPSRFKTDNNHIVHKNFSGTVLELYNADIRKAYLQSLFGCVEQYKQEFPFSYQDMEMWALRSGIKVQHYMPGNHYDKWHCENDGGANVVTRHLVYMTYLNNINDGGGTEFLHQRLEVKPEKGLTLIWPADWTHMHRGIVAPYEEKYIITGWFIFNQNRVFAEGGYYFKDEE